jgi:hypothetical protein
MGFEYEGDRTVDALRELRERELAAEAKKAEEQALIREKQLFPSRFTVKDSGERQEFNTGAKRDTQTDKPRFGLIPPLALKRVATLYARGAQKYDEHNWVKGIPASRCYESMMRHAFQFGAGDTDEDHLAAVVFNALAIMHYQEAERTDMLDMFDWKNTR